MKTKHTKKTKAKVNKNLLKYEGRTYTPYCHSITGGYTLARTGNRHNTYYTAVFKNSNIVCPPIEGDYMLEYHDHNTNMLAVLYHEGIRSSQGYKLPLLDDTNNSIII
ncbi:MAG TPA: hypothetical protein DC057_01145 [Spirochaetia bacterium]|nr:hypothetical protein [Spirochaetia bacterium]